MTDHEDKLGFPSHDTHYAEFEVSGHYSHSILVSFEMD